VVREEALDEVDGLLEPVKPLAEARSEVEPERLVLPPEPAAADAQDEPAVRHVVQGRRELGRQARVPERVSGHEQPEAGFGRQRCERGKRRPALELPVAPVALVGEEVIVEPETVEARLLGRQAGVPERRPVGPLDPVGRAESHRRIVGR
jgi:hypothetical protein